MNREERRKAQKAGIDHKLLRQVQEQTKKDTIDSTADLVLASALLVLRDQFGFGEGRAKRFAEHFSEVFDDVNSGRIDFLDIMETIEQELKIQFKTR